MANKIQVKRGAEANLPALDVGEPAFTTDTKKPFIGSDSGNIELATKEQINSLEDQLADGTAGIDDSIVSDSKVWSSAKVQEQVQLIPKGDKGDTGFNAYELWLSQGNTGTIHDFYRNALRIFVVEEGELPNNPQEGDILFVFPSYEMPDDYLLRFDASQLNLPDNTNITQWMDLSVNNYNLTPHSFPKQPLYLETGYNGKPTVKFDGTNALRCSGFTLDKTDGFTLFIVAKLNTLSSATFFDLVKISETHPTMSKVSATYSGSANAVRARINGNLLEPGVSLDTSPFVYTHKYNKIKSTIYKNGILSASSNFTENIDSPDGISIAAIYQTASNLNGLISEIVYFSRTLTDDERFDTEMYLMRKWGIV